jgi:predicted Ser/Thr protein kinase
MDAERWQKIRDLFDRAQGLEPIEREELLGRSCAGDEALRGQVEKLLESFDSAASFMESPAAAEAASMFEEKRTLISAPGTTGSQDGGTFLAGTILADRYRIVGLLGKGGMGEVFKAEDIKLGQTVALKFLPENLRSDKVELDRLIAEVRMARQVAHPNVCRVFDIGEVAGRSFLSMEFIDGDDLSSLLRRIGRLPSDKAVEISRQLCFGLAAIHDAGILHRDLKPANIIVDSKGKARITDFGIAGHEEELKSDGVRVGTPAYMSPEQIEGGEISQRSDIYSLGLLLYEIFTGRQAFQSDSMADLLLKQRTTAPTNPSVFLKDIDPQVEKTILQCIEKDAKMRPESALQVAMMLPGGNPLEAAIAAGETPSPSAVAAAPKSGALKPAVAAALLLFIFGSLVYFAVASRTFGIHRLVPLEKPPEVLKQRARDLAVKYGYPAYDSTHGFFHDPAYIEHVEKNDRGPARWEKLTSAQPAVLKFWYRQSPVLLEPLSFGTVSVQDPPNQLSGMVQMNLDTRGRLIYFDGVPPRIEGSRPDGAGDARLDWADLLKESGLNLNDFNETESAWLPPRAFDERRAWSGFYPSQPEIPIRIEAAAYRGRLVQFQVVEPWTQPEGEAPYQGGVGNNIDGFILTAIFFVVMFLAAALATRNVRGGRSDLSGAVRVGIFLFLIRLLAWGFQAHHVASIGEIWLFLSGLSWALFWGCFVGLQYLAFEPYLRKYAPERVISWNRLLAGHWRDPLVGRDLLVGGAIGFGMIVAGTVSFMAVGWLGGPAESPHSISNPGGAMLLGIRGFPTLFLNQTAASLTLGFMVSFLVLVSGLLLRSKKLGAVAIWLLLLTFASADTIASGEYVAGVFYALAFATALVVSASRFGVLTTVSMFLFYHLVVFYPITTELSAWYAGDFILCSIILLALAGFGFYTSLAGAPLFQHKILADYEGS